jgi:hypothetical protein
MGSSAQSATAQTRSAPAPISGNDIQDEADINSASSRPNPTHPRGGSAIIHTLPTPSSAARLGRVAHARAGTTATDAEDASDDAVAVNPSHHPLPTAGRPEQGLPPARRFRRLGATAQRDAADRDADHAAHADERRTCPLCTAKYSTLTSGPGCFAAHINRVHAGSYLPLTAASALAGLVTRCDACQAARAAAATACACGSSNSTPFHAGDRIVGSSTEPRRRVPTSTAARADAAAAVAESRADANVPPPQAMILALDRECLERVATELDSWASSETIVNIPERCRPLLAEIFAATLEAMVQGNVAAGLLMRCLPKLLLHRASLHIAAAGETATAIRRRCVMLLTGRVTELVARTRVERSTPPRQSAKRPLLSAESAAIPAVKRLARAGAFSKAIKRLTSQLASYDRDAELQWATSLIPNPPPGTTTLGAKAICHEDHLADCRTCATDIAAPPPVADRIQPAGDDSGDDSSSTSSSDIDGDHRPPPRAPQQRRPAPAPTAFATGVRFAALSAPGPSGLRAEHLRAFATARVARSRLAYEGAMRAFVAAAVAGKLPVESCWWLTDSSLTFARKPGAAASAAPRPLRVGEVLRRFVAKRITAAERARIQQVFARRRQFGAACPGGVEILIHMRILAREHDALHSDTTTDIGEWDSDLKNCFGSLFWPAIDKSIMSHVPGALPWTRWCHSQSVRVLLPKGGIHIVQRGAEQGDPLGPIYAAAVIADVCESAAALAQQMRGRLARPPTFDAVLTVVAETRANTASAGPTDLAATYAAHGQTLSSAFDGRDATRVQQWDATCASRVPHDPSLTPLRCHDVWYLDDSWVRASLLDGDLWLAALDMVGTAVGIERSATKSTFRTPHPHAPVPPYTSLTTVHQPHSAPLKFLGIQLNDPTQQLVAKGSECADLHKAIRLIDDPALELVLIRECVDVGKVTHLLRAIGPTIVPSPARPDPPDPPEPPDPPDPPDRPSGGRTKCPGFPTDAINGFDSLARDAVCSITRSDAPDHAIEQASWGVRSGGLGLRPASVVVLPAHVASLIESRPFVEWLCTQAEAAGVPYARDPVSHGRRCDQAVQRLVDGNTRLNHPLREAISKAAERAASLAKRILIAQPAAAPAPAPQPAAYTQGAATLTADIAEPGNRPAPRAAGGAHLQQSLLECIDGENVRRVLGSLRASTQPHDVARHRRLADLANQHTTHDWLWAINHAHGYVLQPESYITALRLRLGIPIATFPGARPCGSCHTRFAADGLNTHALNCAKGPRVVGHNYLRDHVAALARVSDSSTEVEAVPVSATSMLLAASSPAAAHVQRRRPADILTSAAPLGGGAGRRVALDIGVTSPFIGECIRSPAVDALQEMRARKLHDNTHVCADADWDYRPLIFSAFGRAHDDTRTVIHRLALAAARAFGGADVARIETTWWRNASTLLMERCARMVQRCLPHHQLPPIIAGVNEDRRDCHHDTRRHHSRNSHTAEALVAFGDSHPVPRGEHTALDPTADQLFTAVTVDAWGTGVSAAPPHPSPQ